MQYRNRFPLTSQAGFTLIETMVVVVILGILSAVLLNKFMGSTVSTRATGLVTTMQLTAGSLDRYKAELGCYPNRFDALWDRTKASAADTFCGLDHRPGWMEAFMKPQQVSADAPNNTMLLDDVQRGVTLAIARQAGGLGTRWVLTAANVPNDIATLAIAKCNATDPNAAMPVAFNANLKCIGTANGAELTNVTMMFTETR